ncbi:MAG: restriction endonuclease subunit S [Candidatus Bathyarchaeota archaeon]|nr:restriction endonuclease subunit S [Candidatus Bathyarchaeota archaeon]
MSQLQLTPPQNWKPIKFADVVKFTKKPRGFAYSNYDRIPFVPMELLPTNGLFFKQFILKNPDEITSGIYFEAGDILVAKITPSFENGKQGIIDRLPTPFGFATTEVIPFREFDSKSDKLFLFYYLLRSGIRDELASKMEGTTGRQRLNKSALENLEILLPTLPEQQAISIVLRALQHAREARLHEIALERERKAALMEHLFTLGTRGEPTKQTEIGEMPESWQELKLGDICSITTGTTPSTDQPEYYKGSIPFIKTSEITNKRIRTTGTYISEAAVEKFNLKRYLPGTVFLAMYGQGKTRGQVALLEISATTTQNTAAIVSNERLNPEFLWQWLMNQYDKLREAGSQGHISHLNLGYVKQYKIPLPPKSEQYFIASILNACECKIDALEHEAR